jgi:hypothetical protein
MKKRSRFRQHCDILKSVLQFLNNEIAYLIPEDWGSMFLLNVGIHLEVRTATTQKTAVETVAGNCYRKLLQLQNTLTAAVI